MDVAKLQLPIVSYFLETKFNSLGLVLAVGGLDPNNKKTELLETTTNTILKIISLYKDLLV